MMKTTKIWLNSASAMFFSQPGDNSTEKICYKFLTKNQLKKPNSKNQHWSHRAKISETRATFNGCVEDEIKIKSCNLTNETILSILCNNFFFPVT